MIPGKSAKLSYFSINIVVSQVLGQAEVGIVVAVDLKVPGQENSCVG